MPSQKALGERLRKFLRPDSPNEIGAEVLAPGMMPRAPQVDVLDAATQALLENRGSGLFVRPPRTGKTILFGALTKGLGLRTAILVPNKDLVDQTYDKLLNVVGIPEHKIGMLHSDVSGELERIDALDKDVLVTTYDTFRNLVAKGLTDPDDRPFLVLDEVHRAQGEVTRPIVRYFMDHGALVHGWTATDTLADGTNVSEALFDSAPPIHETSFHEAAKNGEIAPTRNIVFETDVRPNYKVSDLTGGDDFSDRVVAGIIKQNGRDEAAISKIMGFTDTVTHKDGKKIVNHFCNLPQLWYCAGVDHAAKIARDLNAKYETIKADKDLRPIRGVGSQDSKYAGGIDLSKQYAIVISGDTPKEDVKDKSGKITALGRRSIFDAYKRGDIRCLISADMLVEGYDFPHCELTVMLKPTKSPRVAVQAGARSTGLNEDDPYKIGYVASMVDDISEATYFGKVVGGLWHAPDEMRDYNFEPSEKPRDIPSRDDLPSIRTVYSPAEYINFTERRAGLRVMSKDIPSGHVEATKFLRRPDYRKFVDFDGKLELVFQEFERQYHEAQLLLPEEERYRKPFTTPQGVEVMMAVNITGGQTLVVHEQQMDRYVRKEMMPEPLLPPPPAGFVRLRDILRDYQLRQVDYSKLELAEQNMARQYRETQREIDDIDARHKQPVTTEQNVPVIRAAFGRRNTMFCEEQALRRYLEKDLKITPRAPSLKPGFLTLMQIRRVLDEQLYAVKPAKLEDWFKDMQRSFTAHLSGTHRLLRDADVYVNKEGIAFTVARTPQGNQLVVANAPWGDGRNVDAITAAIKKLGLKKKLPLLAPLPPELEKKYVLFDNVVRQVVGAYGESVSGELNNYRDKLEDAYDEQQEKMPEAGRYQVMRTSSGLHLIKARRGEKLKANGFFIHRDDVKLLIRKMGFEETYQNPPAGFITYEAAIDELKLAGFKDKGVSNTLLQLLQLEYDQAQQGLPIKERHLTPYTSEEYGIRTIKAGSKSGNIQVFSQEDLLKQAPRFLKAQKRAAPAVKLPAQPKPEPLAERVEPELVPPKPREGETEAPTTTVSQVIPLERYIAAIKDVPDLRVFEEDQSGDKRHIKVAALGGSLKGYPRETTVKPANPKSMRQAEAWVQQILAEANERHQTDFMASK